MGDVDIKDALARSYKESGDFSTRQLLIEKSQSLVRSIAWKFVYWGEPFEDLVSEGNIGLIKAVDDFDFQRRTKFSTYAGSRVIGAIKQHLRDRGWLWRPPRELQELLNRFRQLVEFEKVSTGNDLTALEVAERLQISEEVAIDLLHLEERSDLISLDKHFYHSSTGDAMALCDLMGEPDLELELVVENSNLELALASLDKQSRMIILMRYWGEMRQRTIGQEFGVSGMQISRLEANSICRMRGIIEQIDSGDLATAEALRQEARSYSLPELIETAINIAQEKEPKLKAAKLAASHI